jgi:hypothetical protein
MKSLAKKLVLGLALVAGSFVALGGSQAEAGGYHFGCAPYHYNYFHCVKPYYYHYQCTPYYVPYYKPFCW